MTMALVVAKISGWAHAGEPVAWLVAGAIVAISFVLFNSLRIVLYLPQIATCWRDEAGCPTINLWTWGGWTGANLSTALYMGWFLGDIWGLVLNLGNAAMCAIVVAITCVKRRRGALRAPLAPQSD